jgi:hypothetical protein
MSRQELIDRYFNKAISKTFTVFIISTIALFTSKLSGAEWAIITSIYLGSTKTAETILKLKNKL